MSPIHPIHRKFALLVALVLVALCVWACLAVGLARGAAPERRPYPRWLCHRLPSGRYLKVRVDHKIELMVHLRHKGDIVDWPRSVPCPTGPTRND